MLLWDLFPMMARTAAYPSFNEKKTFWYAINEQFLKRTLKRL